MKLPKFDYAEPHSIREACRLLEVGGGEAQALAGGTELIVALKNREKRVPLLVDLGALPLHRIGYSDAEGLRVGALVSLRHLAAHPTVREKYPILSQAARSVGTVALQAMGTVGGNLCQDTCCMYLDRSAWARQSREPCHKQGGHVCHVARGSQKCWASYAGDLAPALLVLGAKLRIADCHGEQVLPLRELFSADGNRPHTLRPGQLVTEIQVPSPLPSSGGAYLKLRQREALDYPMIGVAAHLVLKGRGAVCKDAALALTAVGRAPVVVEEAGALKGKKLTGALIQKLAQAARQKAHPVKNVCGLPVRYRLDMVEVYVESAVEQARQAAAG